MEIIQIIGSSFGHKENPLIGSVTVLLPNGSAHVYHARLDKDLGGMYIDCHYDNYVKIWNYWCKNNFSRIGIKN